VPKATRIKSFPAKHSQVIYLYNLKNIASYSQKHNIFVGHLQEHPIKKTNPILQNTSTYSYSIETKQANYLNEEHGFL
jgi:hypothetical protein